MNNMISEIFEMLKFLQVKQKKILGFIKVVFQKWNKQKN